MATEDIVFKVSVDGDGSGGKSLSALKKEFKELQKELDNTTVGTAKYNQVLQQLGAVRDDIGDLNQTINALNPEGKVQAFANVAGKLAGGFQAATGAAALFGVQSEELEKTLLRVQAATALSMGIQSVVGLADAFKVLGTVIAANPIMAIATVIIGITTAVVAFTRENKNLTNSIEEQKSAVDAMKQSYDEYLSLLEASGSSYEKIAVERVKAYENEIKNLDVLKREYDNLYATSVAGSEEQKKAEIEYTKISQEQAKLRHLIELEFVKADKYIRDQAIKQREEDEKKAAERRDERVKEEIRVHKQNTLEKLEAERIIEAEAQAEFDAIFKEKEQTDELESYLEFEWTKMMAALDVERRGAEMKKEIDDKAKAEKLKAEQEARNAEFKIQQNYFNSVADLSAVFFNLQLASAKGNEKNLEELRKKQFNVDKAFKAAQATLSAYQSIATTLGTGGAFAVPLAISTGIAAFAQVAKILSTPYNGGASSNQSSDINIGNAPQIQTQAPTVGTPLTRLNEQGQNLSKSVRAYVVETDVSESQQRVRRLEEQATF